MDPKTKTGLIAGAVVFGPVLLLAGYLIGSRTSGSAESPRPVYLVPRPLPSSLPPEAGGGFGGWIEQLAAEDRQKREARSKIKNR